jgi:hypothetical protein
VQSRASDRYYLCKHRGPPKVLDIPKGIQYVVQVRFPHVSPVPQQAPLHHSRQIVVKVEVKSEERPGKLNKVVEVEFAFVLYALAANDLADDDGELHACIWNKGVRIQDLGFQSGGRRWGASCLNRE